MSAQTPQSVSALNKKTLMNSAAVLNVQHMPSRKETLRVGGRGSGVRGGQRGDKGGERGGGGVIVLICHYIFIEWLHITSYEQNKSRKTASTTTTDDSS